MVLKCETEYTQELQQNQLPSWQQTKRDFPWIKFDLANFIAKGRLLSRENRSFFGLWIIKKMKQKNQTKRYQIPIRI